MRPESEERVPKYDNQEEEHGMWQMQPSHLSITLNFFLLKRFLWFLFCILLQYSPLISLSIIVFLIRFIFFTPRVLF